MPAIIIIYIVVSLALTFWAFSDMAYHRGLRHRTRWWLLLAILPILGFILYFHNKRKKEFDPSFRERRFS